jgi:peptide/nickel transport system substrate-binding protein
MTEYTNILGYSIPIKENINLTATKPTTGGTLYMITSSDQFDHVDPARIYKDRDISLLKAYLFRTLVAYNPVPGNGGTSLVADLATNTGVPSNGGKTWKFTLRPGITWEDGTPITAADVVYGISRCFATDVITDGPDFLIKYLNIPKNTDGSSKYKGPYKKTGQALFDKAVSLKGNTITFNLNRSIINFNYILTFPCCSPVKKSKDTGDKYDLNPFSCGPYKIASYKIGDEMKLVRNPKWNKSSDLIRTPYPDNIIISFGIDENVIDQIILQDEKSNTLFLDTLSSSNLIKFFEDPKRKTQRGNFFDGYVRYFAANISNGHLSNKNLRKAIFYAIDTKSILDLNGGIEFYGKAGDNIINPNLVLDYAKTKGNIYDPDWKLNGNPVYAKKLLESIKTTDPDSYIKATDDGIVLDLPKTPINEKLSVLLTNSLREAGIILKINFIPSNQYYSTILNNEKQNDMSNATWGADYNNASTVIPELFTKEGSFNLCQNWNDSKYEPFLNIVNKALKETDRKKQAVLWKQAAQYVMDEYWILTPIFRKTQLVWGSKVGNVFFHIPYSTYLFGKIYVKK